MLRPPITRNLYKHVLRHGVRLEEDQHGGGLRLRWSLAVRQYASCGIVLKHRLRAVQVDYLEFQMLLPPA